jgi:hypothetical protein
MTCFINLDSCVFICSILTYIQLLSFIKEMTPKKLLAALLALKFEPLEIERLFSMSTGPIELVESSLYSQVVFV